jgi:hypothetical protein
MMFERLRSAVVGMVPPAAGFSLAQVNALLGFVSLCIGIAFTLWNWRRIAREASEKKSAPFPPTPSP